MNSHKNLSSGGDPSRREAGIKNDNVMDRNAMM